MSNDGTDYDDILRDMARDAIETGKLPGRSPDRVMGGRGGGTQCAVCGVPVESTELGFEIEFTSRNGSGPRRHHVHIRCYSVLELQLQGPGFSTGTSLPSG